MPEPLRPCLLYHFVHLDTLPAILAAGELRSTNELERLGQRPETSVASASLQRRRSRTRVPLGGTLHDYVPFYFAPRSPMLYRIGKEWADKGTGDAADVVYLVSSVEQVTALGLPFTFTLYHAVTRPNEFLTDPADLHRVDWPLMYARMWTDAPDDNDRQRRRQAEFLVRDRLPLSALVGYATVDEPRADRVATLVDEHGLSLRGKPKPEWYFHP
jgi:hypothetical protein